jgi:type I restriction enzyme R subunit
VSFEKVLTMVGAGVVDADLASTLAARLARLDCWLRPADKKKIAEAAGGVELSALVHQLLQSVDADVQTRQAAEKFQLPPGQEPTEEQLAKVEQELVAAALRPFHNPKLRNLILDIARAAEQIIDTVNQDDLLDASFSAQALEKARALTRNFAQFIADHKDELEVIQLLYSRPYRAGLRYRHLKELAEVLKRPPVNATPERLWHAFRAIEPDAVPQWRGKPVVNLIALVRHALDPATPVIPFADTIDERYRAWLAAKEAAGIAFTPQQRQWLDAIKDHIANSLRIEPDDLEEPPLRQLGGLGKAHEVFGDRLEGILDELNTSLAA